MANNTKSNIFQFLVTEFRRKERSCQRIRLNLKLTVSNFYCLHTIFQKLHFSKSHHVIFLQPKSRKNCRKNFENRFSNKIIMPIKIILNRPFACAREVIQTPKNENQANLWRVWHSAIHTQLLYNSILVWCILNEK